MAHPLGYVTGRLIGHDDRPARGKVTFTPRARRVLPDATPPATAVPSAVTVNLDEAGSLAAEGLVPAWYDVTFRLLGVSVPGYPIHVTDEHTVDHPLDLSLEAPMVPTPEVKFVVNEGVYKGAVQAAQDAQTARSGAETAADAARTARADAQTAATTAGDASTAAGLARSGAETAADAARTARTEAETANTAAQRARTGAEQAAQAGSFVLSPSADVSGVLDLSALDRNTVAHRRVTGNLTGVNLPTAPYAGQLITVILTQDSVGSRTLATPSAILSAYGLDPVLSTAPNAIDVLHFWRDGVRWWVFVGALGGA